MGRFDQPTWTLVVLPVLWYWPQLAQLCFEKVQKTDGVTEIPYDRWDVDEYFDPSPNAVGRILGVGLAGCWSDWERTQPEKYILLLCPCSCESYMLNES